MSVDRSVYLMGIYFHLAECCSGTCWVEVGSPDKEIPWQMSCQISAIPCDAMADDDDDDGGGWNER